MPNNKLKILVINWQDIKNPNGGGAEVHFHEIFKRIAAKGHQVDLFCCGDSSLADLEVIDDINIIRRGSRNTFNFIVPKVYKDVFSKNKYDIIIDDINKIPFYTPLYVKEPLLALSHHFFGASIFREASIPAGLYVNLAEFMMKFIYYNTKFAVVSQSTLDDFIKRGYDKSNFKIITNAISHSEYPMKIGKKNDEFTITYFGRLKKYKSVDHLLRAFAIVKKLHDNCKLSIIGRGDYRGELERLAKELKIDDKIIFHGFVDDVTKNELLCNSHIVVNTSLKEGWGITNIEANACGTPVLSANVPGLRDSVRNGVSGLLYEYGNIEEMAVKLKFLIDNKSELSKMENGAVEWAKQFSWDKSAEEMLNYIKEVVNLNIRK